MMKVIFIRGLHLQGMGSTFQVMQVCNVFQRGLRVCALEKEKGTKDADTSQLLDVAHTVSSRRGMAKTRNARETIEMMHNAWSAQKIATGILADNC